MNENLLAGKPALVGGVRSSLVHRVVPLRPSRHDQIEEPIRAELFGIERLEQHAESLASAQRIISHSDPGRPMLSRVADNGRVLRDAHRTITLAIQQERWITPAAEWLVDNFVVVDEQLREIREDLPAGFYRELPKLADGPLARYPRVYGIAWAYVAHTDSRFDPDTLCRFVRAYQRVQPLTIGELWAVAITLRVVLVENLRRMADAIVHRRVAQQEANAFADSLLGLDSRGGSPLAASWQADENAPLVTEFAVELVQRLRNHDPAVTPALMWLHQRLAAQGTTPDEITLVEHQRQAATTVTVRNVITSMRLMSALDWRTFFESVSLVDELLRADSDFAAMDFPSRDAYRHAIEELARGSRRSELDVTRDVLAQATSARARPPNANVERDGRCGDPGFYLVGGGRRDFERVVGFRPGLRLRLWRAFVDAATPGYLGTFVVLIALILALPVAISVAAGMHLATLLALTVLAVVPASDLAIALLNRGVTGLVPPSLPPRLELRDGVPAEFRTMVVVPTLLTGRADVEEQIERLELHYLANADGHVRFALLSDWQDATTEHAAGDADILAAARARISSLNARHGPAPDGEDRFLLYHRRRLWNESEGVWMGWERKRGKLSELNRLLRGANDTTFLATPEVARPATGVRYVITLDADTRMPIGAVQRLVGTMAHPLNRPRLDPTTKRVVEGYAVLQPRVTPPLPGRFGSLFQWLCSGSAGVDPYAAAVSDVYQDLFGEGSYTGKGIYDVDAFEVALAGRVPENSLLSHDLFECLFARARLASNIEVFEAQPANYLAAAARQHRWARGDWQLLPWILRGRFSVIGRWKMIDNLRRTLSMPFALLTLIVGWAAPAPSPALWTLLVLATIAVPRLLPVFTGLVPHRSGVSKRSHIRAVARDLWLAVCQTLLAVTMMAHQAWLMADALVRTLTRIYVTRRRLLEWTPAAHAAASAPLDIPTLYRRMGGATILAVASIAPVMWRPDAWPIAFPIIVLWLLSPAIARWVSLPGVPGPVASLSPTEARTLRLIARRTWRFFMTFVGSESHALPPDNFQEIPHPVVVHRTSPTNIGLYLLSAVSARDFGWIGGLDLVDRLESTLETVAGLEHYRGHLYNWYDTRDCRPLEPKYVSSVDSGNLAGALLTLGNACREMLEQPIVGAAALAGIEDAALLLREAAHETSVDRQVDVAAHRRLDEALDVVLTVIAQSSHTPAEWAAQFVALETAVRTAVNWARTVGGGDAGNPHSAVLVWSHALLESVETHARDLDTLLPWVRLRVDGSAIPAMQPLAKTLTLADLPAQCDAVARDLLMLRTTIANADAVPSQMQNIDMLVVGLERSVAAARALIERLTKIADGARAIATAMDFGFLFDASRMLFAIGYRISDGSFDAGRYDLLASEARIMSLIAIAKGDVPVRHWFRLGRLLTPVENDSVLMSWSGSMFEYLMPALLLQAPVGSLLEQTCRLVVRRQIRYGQERGVPWGISESGYHARDLEMTYQYSSFGVPNLGLKRGLANDVVVAPYATALAAMIEPSEAIRNFRKLADAGADGDYGFYESLDYTTPRHSSRAGPEVVRMYMAHHQGMAIVSIANVLNGGAMRKRFHAEPIVRASELLLQERTPRDVAVARPRIDTVASAVGDVRELALPHARRFSSPLGTTPRTHLLSNGRYTVMITAAGSGYSRYHDLAITRWREDATRDDSGSYILLRDVASGERWSTGFQPSAADPQSYEVSFSEDRAEFVRRDGAIITRLEVIVSSEDDAEVRRVSLTNTGSRTREIEVTSYAEIVLATAAADAAHPAFSNLFVETEGVSGRNTLLATRRARSQQEPRVWLAHVLAVEGETIGDLEWETDRAQFLGRGREVRTANAVNEERTLSNTVGAVLDPIVSLRRRVRIRPGKTVRVTFSTLVGSSRSDVLDIADKYHDVTTFDRVATLAWTQAQVQLRHLGIPPDEANLFQTLGASVLYANRSLRAPPQALAQQIEGVGALWVHGISGDLPIVLVQIDDADDIGIVRQLLRAHEYWRTKRLAVDLVILNDRAPSYLQDLQTLLETLVRTSQSMPAQEGQESRGSVFILRADRVTAAQHDVLQAVARVALSSRRGTLTAQVTRVQRPDVGAISSARRLTSDPMPVAREREHPELEFFNGRGGFATDQHEYRIVLGAGEFTPAPWVNVIANQTFGCLVSEAGSGCTWSINSQENRLTAWSNDPVSDPPSEMFYVRDEESGDLWSPTPLPVREGGGEYVVHHGQGYTRFQYDSHGIATELMVFVPADDPVKISRLTLTNHSPRARRLSVTAYLEWVLGVSRSGSAPFVVTEIDTITGAMFARNCWSRDFSTRIAFADLGGIQSAWTGDRTEFLGRNGNIERPAALAGRDKLSGRSGAGFDPCCALQSIVEIPPGGGIDVVFSLGEADTREQARILIQHYRSVNLEAQLKTVIDGWDEVLGTLQVTTPDRSLDLLLNRWLLYQTIACRLWARTAFYQSSGAYGFRDQLQDVMSVAVSRPDLTRAHLLKAASRQFVEGDVQHWWHEPVGRGVRTRISDDLLWLPYVANHYLEVTGDQAILDEVVPFLEGAPLAAGQSESYFEPRVSALQGTLFEHCARALDRSLAVGTHGLPLMGAGDWNDGMNRVGAEGKGESVWLAWFLHSVLAAWAPLAQARGEDTRAQTWMDHAAALKEAIEREGWDGEWYRRAYFDDGKPLGSSVNDACAIDSIAQSWSVISRVADPDRARRAMASVDQRLIRRDDGLILLLAPPFDNTQAEPGYIKGYPPGVRENGGQYTHAAAWAVIAFAALGDGDKIAELLAMLNPISHTATPRGVRQYKVEPYVVAGDVYSEAPHVGRGGWTWYTGSAGWLYHAGIEWLLGFRLKGARLALDPCIPKTWEGFAIAFRHRSTRYDIVVENPRGVNRGISVLELDGIALENLSGVPLVDDGKTHLVRAVLGEASPGINECHRKPSTGIYPSLDGGPLDLGSAESQYLESR